MSPAYIPIPLRMEKYTDKSRECWIWKGHIDANTGYGRISINRKSHGAHRVAYELAVGPIPEGLVIDHLCRNRACVRPDHLEAVTYRENTWRGLRVFDFTGMCYAQLHDMTDASNIQNLRDGTRRCRPCENDRQRRRYRARKARRTVGP